MSVPIEGSPDPSDSASKRESEGEASVDRFVPTTDGDIVDEGETPDALLGFALARLRYEDAAEWLRLLEQAGFSHAEAGRLIFERLRPRDEGIARS